jgi:hypothetical protein
VRPVADLVSEREELSRTSLALGGLAVLERALGLRVDLDAAVARERVAQDMPVLREQLRVALAVLVEQPGRALDVGEEEGDGPEGRSRCTGRHDAPEQLVSEGRCVRDGSDGTPSHLLLQRPGPRARSHTDDLVRALVAFDE